MNYRNLFLIFAVICFQILWYYIFKFCGSYLCTLPPLGAVVGAEGVHDVFKSATISAGVTTLGELGKCLTLPVTK